MDNKKLLKLSPSKNILILQTWGGQLCRVPKARIDKNKENQSIPPKLFLKNREENGTSN